LGFTRIKKQIRGKNMTEIGIVAVGGYNEMGRNMTAVIIGEDIIILDMGLRLDRVQIHDDV
jgi:ribonuclease J